MPAPQLSNPNAAPKKQGDICLFGQTNYRGQKRRFGIKTDDRRRHMYIIGKTGMGKSTMMENMMLSDIYSGKGVGLVDPHGDFAEKIIDFIPPHRINDVVYLNPSDLAYPIGFNILEVKNEEQKHLVAAGMMGTFKKIWPDVWSSRMEYILNNTLLALLDNPGSTLLGINRLMSDKKYRKKMVAKVTDPVVKAFWQVEFASYSERYAQEATSSVQNKIGQFLSTTLIRNMVAQPKSTINVREIMDEGKIFVMNLSKGRMGEDNSRLLGGMLITKIQLSAMERVDTPEEERTDFFLYVDEFQNFATPSFANILSEARKYHLGLIMAHQYVAQLDEVVADAVFGNVGTICTFRIGAADAEALAKEFAPNFTEEDILQLAKFKILLKLMIDGLASAPFSADTMPPIAARTDSAEKVIRVSRERYGKRREDIEEKVMRWSGLAPNESKDIDTTNEKKQDKKGSSGGGKKREEKGGKKKQEKKSSGGQKAGGRKEEQKGKKGEPQKKEQKAKAPEKAQDGNQKKGSAQPVPVAGGADKAKPLDTDAPISLDDLLPPLPENTAAMPKPVAPAAQAVSTQEAAPKETAAPARKKQEKAQEQKKQAPAEEKQQPQKPKEEKKAEPEKKKSEEKPAEESAEQKNRQNSGGEEKKEEEQPKKKRKRKRRRRRRKKKNGNDAQQQSAGNQQNQEQKTADTPQQKSSATQESKPAPSKDKQSQEKQPPNPKSETAKSRVPDTDRDQSPAQRLMASQSSGPKPLQQGSVVTFSQDDALDL